MVLRKKSNTMLGVDIGTSKICAALCDIDKHRCLTLRGIGTSISLGLKKGEIVDIDALSYATEKAIRRAELSAEISSAVVFINIPFHSIRLTQNIGLVVSDNISGQISVKDREAVIQKSRNIIKKAEECVVHISPAQFKVDGMTVKNPLGVFGKSLEVLSTFVLSHQAVIHDLRHMFQNKKRQVQGVLFDSLGVAHIMATENERQQGVLLIDIGGHYTKVMVIKNNVLINGQIIPLGGETVTSDIAICLNVTIPEAERLKLLYGTLETEARNKKETIQITGKNSDIKQLKLKMLSEIIEARIKEIYRLIDQKDTVDVSLVTTVVLGGGSSMLKGLSSYTEQFFSLPVREGVPERLSSVIDNPGHASALGLLFKAAASGSMVHRKTSLFSLFNIFRP